MESPVEGLTAPDHNHPVADLIPDQIARSEVQLVPHFFLEW